MGRDELGKHRRQPQSGRGFERADDQRAGRRALIGHGALGVIEQSRGAPREGQ